MNHTRSRILGNLRGKCKGTLLKVRLTVRRLEYIQPASLGDTPSSLPNIRSLCILLRSSRHFPAYTILRNPLKKQNTDSDYTLLSPHSAPPLSVLCFTYKLPCSQILSAASSPRLLPRSRSSPLLILSAVLPSRVPSPFSRSLAVPGYPSSFSSFLDSVSRV
jgi:hypothetical protein